jgi:hypothetical protein
MFNPLLQYVPNRFNVLAMERLYQYRIGPWQPRFYTVPIDVTIALTAGTTLSQNLLMQPGSHIIGLNFSMVSGSASDILYRLRDPDVEYVEGQTGYNFTDGNNKFLNCSTLVPQGSGGVAASGAGIGLTGMRFCLLTAPYDVNDGTITVELSNRNPNVDLMCQLLLYVMEPFTTDNQAVKQ